MEKANIQYLGIMVTRFPESWVVFRGSASLCDAIYTNQNLTIRFRNARTINGTSADQRWNV